MPVYPGAPYDDPCLGQLRESDRLVTGGANPSRRLMFPIRALLSPLLGSPTGRGQIFRIPGDPGYYG
jgi:hypothetical protein